MRTNDIPSYLVLLVLRRTTDVHTARRLGLTNVCCRFFYNYNRRNFDKSRTHPLLNYAEELELVKLLKLYIEGARNMKMSYLRDAVPLLVKRFPEKR